MIVVASLAFQLSTLASVYSGLHNDVKLLSQSRNLPTYFFSFGAFAALAEAFARNEFGLNPRGYGLNSGRAAPLVIL